MSKKKSNKPKQNEKSSAESSQAKKENTAQPNENPPEDVQAPIKPYYAGIDIVKILAVFMVVCIHTYLYDGMYYEPITDKKFLLPIALRWISYTCVPLFMISTGYLMKNKKFSGKYYLGLIKIIVIYIIVSLICMRFNHEHFNTDFSDPWKVLKGFLEFNNANYGWYINYYISIFLCIPFLNLAFNGLQTKGQRFILVFTVATLTIFARSLYIGFDRTNQIRLLPDYLNGAWPLAYYFAGAFIREYPPKRCVRNKLIIFAALAGVTWFITKSTYNQSIENIEENQRFLSWHFNDYGTYPVFLIAVLIFMLLFDITTKNKIVTFVLRQISGTTLALYMISYVFDNKYYLDFNAKYPDVYERWTHSFEIIGKNFLLSLLCALVIHNVYNLCEYGVKSLIKEMKAKKNTETTS
ncbi:MAG: acyltransferase [Ruminococcus sp.]|nr:acyltransferase [Ruminococcus sp.]